MEEPLPAWLAWPIRAVAVVVVVPFKLAWDLLVLVGGWIWRYIGKPVGWFLHYCILRPVAYAFYYVVWVPLHWLVVNVLWRPLAWLGRHVLLPLLTALWHGLVALKPVWVFLGRVLLEAARGVAWALRLLYRYVLTPLGKALYYALVVPLVFVWQWVVVPVARAVAWAWNHSVVLLWRYLVVIPIRWTWRTLVVPPAKWVHAAILHPTAEATRRVLAAIGLR
ncbi:hypothetical protein ABZS66_55980 [Dactylosporangium sp. NPDC005572]|uniref:hypothetical protein n=1 Tax=Dactylosporangium sp. NPDC005572 TaxID=3156889 RepID=UPI0033A87E64